MPLPLIIPAVAAVAVVIGRNIYKSGVEKGQGSGVNQLAGMNKPESKHYDKILTLSVVALSAFLALRKKGK